MSAAKSLLIELGTEELPPKALDELAAAFLRGVCDGLAKHGIDAALDEAKAYCSPRRLAVYVPNVSSTYDFRDTKFGPPVSVGLNADGEPTPALRGFAARFGASVSDISRQEVDGVEKFAYSWEVLNQSTAACMPEIVEEALKGLPIPRPMRWADHDYSFVRPVHWLVILHGAEIIDGDVLGLKSGRKSRGHRFMHPQPVHVADADGWLDAMRAANVLADPVEREKRITHELSTAGGRLRGETGRQDLSVHLDPDNLEEVKNLTEWPVAISCSFDAEFLGVPQEALIQTMQSNQKFFPVLDGNRKLTEHFIGIANIQSKDPAEIRKGYERVIRPRFADAKFFWEEDLKTPLASYQEQLKGVTYQQALGSQWNKSVRVAELARVIANRVGVDAAHATRAAALGKCDLLTRMVGEFPELQGVMGRYYARHDGEPAEVAEALDSYYQPRFGGDAIAADKLGQVLAVAERLDTLAGIFAVGMKPGGNKDPFALRRAALGLGRTLIEAGMELDLRGSLVEALELLPDTALLSGLKPGKDGKPPTLNAGQRRANLVDELYDFILDRLRGYYAEQGFDNAQFESVLAVEPGSLADFDRRLRAVAEFGRRPEAASLAAANKRVANILRKQAEEAGAPAIGRMVDPAHFESEAERELADALAAAQRDTAEALAAGDYTSVLARLSQLQAPVDAFFDSVLVNADDPAVRANRLALLGQLKSQFSAIADIAVL